MSRPVKGSDSSLLIAWRPSDSVRDASRLSSFLAACDIPNLPALRARADADPAWFWTRIFAVFDLPFDLPFEQMLSLEDGVERPCWCVGGRTNLSLACLDRHFPHGDDDKPAIVWSGEDGAAKSLTYAGFAAMVAKFAGLLDVRGVKPGDVVGLYMPMIPEAAAAFMAVVRVGAIVLPLFSGYGPQSIADRLKAAGARVVVTVGAAFRRGSAVPMKAVVDEAVGLGLDLDTVVVVARGPAAPMMEGRDVDWLSMSQRMPAERPPTIVDAEAPAMLVYTSGTTGKPKGTVHTHCGLMGKNTLDVLLCLDLKADDRLLWMSDMGWVIGPKSIIGSLLAGATLVMAEGTPDWPVPGRIGQLIQDHGVTICGIVPTVVRQMMRFGPEVIDGYDLSSLRVTVSSGEPWNEDAWLWFFKHVCGERLPILNYAGGTEIGGAILIGTLHDPLKPCAFGGPVPGVSADIVDAEGRSVRDGEAGELVLRGPSIGITRGLWREPQRFLDSYWSAIPGCWVQGDYARRDEDGLWYLLGRSDDTLKIAGKRTGPAELESILVESGLLVEAAIVGIPDAIAGSALACAAVLADHAPSPDLAAATLSRLLAGSAGAPFRPSYFVFVDLLPRTRNQKIMRRVIRAALVGEDPGDLGALLNPEAITALREATPVRPAAGRDKPQAAAPKERA